MSDFIIATDNPEAWHKAGHEIFVILSFQRFVLDLYALCSEIIFYSLGNKLRYFYLKIHFFPPIES